MTELKNKLIDYVALDSKILVVAVEGSIKDWTAYIGEVPGNDHANEWQEVAKHGTKLDYQLAKILFPTFDKFFTWRD